MAISMFFGTPIKEGNYGQFDFPVSSIEMEVKITIYTPSKSVSLSTWQEELELIHVELMKLWYDYSRLDGRLLELLVLQERILKKGRSL